MIKVSIASLAVFACIGLSQAGLQDGLCGDAIVTWGGYTGVVQCNHDHIASQHYMFQGGVHKLWAYTNDLPHSTTANGKNPRTEINLRQHYSYGPNDYAVFYGEVKVTADTYAPFSFFQIKHEGTQGSTATSAMLNF